MNLVLLNPIMKKEVELVVRKDDQESQESQESQKSQESQESQNKNVAEKLVNKSHFLQDFIDFLPYLDFQLCRAFAYFHGFYMCFI